MAVNGSDSWQVAGSSGVPVVVPLPKYVIEKLEQVKDEIQRKKNDYKERALKCCKGRATFCNIATAFVLFVIEDYVRPTNNRAFIQSSVELVASNDSSLQQLGIDPNQVLVKIAGIQIVLLDLEEAVFRADLFTSDQHLKLREMAARQEAAAPPTVKTNPQKKSTPKATKTTSSKPSLSPKKQSNTTKKPHHCMNGAQCRNILNGTCRYHHTPQEIAQAGAIIEELIGISCCKVGWIIGTNGDNIAAMKETSGADIWIDNQVLTMKQGKVRMLHVLGSRQAVEQGIELVMESAAKCNENENMKNVVEALVGISPAKQQLLVGSTALEEMKQASGADIVVGKGRCSLSLAGTKDAVDKGIELVMEWAATGDVGKGKTKSNSQMTAPAAATAMPEAIGVASLESPADINNDAAFPALLGASEKAVVTGMKSSTNVSADPTGGSNEDWPALETPEKPENGTTQVVPSKPFITPTTKPAKKPNTSVRPTPKAKAKKKYAEQPCMHGVECRFIRHGIDKCDFHHSSKELELAAEARTVEHVMYISSEYMKKVIGRKGASVNEIIQESGASIANDAASKDNDDSRIVRITGTQKSVDMAVEMIMLRLPDGYKGEPGPGVVSQEASVASVSPEPTTPTNPVTPAVRAPSPAPDIQQPLSPPQPIRQLQPEQQVVKTGVALSSNTPVPSGTTQPAQQLQSAQQSMVPGMALSSNTSMSSGTAQPVRELQSAQSAFLSSNTSMSSGTGTFLSEVTRSSSTSLAAFAYGQNEGNQNDSTVVAGETRPTLASSFPNHLAPGMHTVPLEPIPSSQQGMHQGIAATVTPTFETPSAATPTPADTLLAFLVEQAACLKGSPDAFYSFLLAEDIASLHDLAEAATDDEYLREVLQQGDGTVGVKGFKRNAFKKAVVEASQTAFDTVDTGTVSSANTGTNSSTNTATISRTNTEPLTELVCPISHVLMTNDPVIAADGHTYEREAIEQWIHKQSSQVFEAKQQMATVGADSQRARGIIERGVLSPMTHAKMEHLSLTPNHALRTMARDTASSSPT